MCTISYCSIIGKVKVSNVKVVLYGTKSTPDSVKKYLQYVHHHVYRLSIAFLCIVIAVKNFRDPQTLQCLNSCPNGTKVFSNYCIDPSSVFNFTAIPGQSTSTITTIIISIFLQSNNHYKH